MKKLQNNFTTPEQSKRLLALGVPVDSADGYYTDFSDGTHAVYPNYICYRDIEWWNMGGVTPSWSVGRLIEIMTICYKWDLLSCASFRIYMTDIIGHNLINQLINDLSLAISRDKIDFSKLEE